MKSLSRSKARFEQASSKHKNIDIMEMFPFFVYSMDSTGKKIEKSTAICGLNDYR